MRNSYRIIVIFASFLFLMSACGSSGGDATDGDGLLPPADQDADLDAVPSDGDRDTPVEGEAEAELEEADADPEMDGDLDAPELDPEREFIERETEDEGEQSDCANGPDAQCFVNAATGVSGTRCSGSTLAFCEPSVPTPPVCAVSTCRCQAQKSCLDGCVDPDQSGAAYCAEDAPDGDVEEEAEGETDGDPAEDGDVSEAESDVEDEGELAGDEDPEAVDGDPEWSCTPDAFEPNEEQSSAADIEPGDDLSDLRLCPDDDDWFAITLVAGDTLSAAIDFDGEAANLNLYLFDDQGSLLDVSASSSATREEVGWTTAVAAEVALRVATSDSIAAAYVLTVSIENAADGDAEEADWVEIAEIETEKELEPEDTCLDDAFEPNDTKETAADIATIPYEGLVLCPENDDYYAITLAEDDFIAVDLLFTHSLGNLDLYIYKPDGSLLQTHVSETDNENANFWVTQPGRHLIRVLSRVGEGNVYDLSVTIQPSQLCEDDTFEENDSLAAAAAISAGDHPGLKLCGYDVDWYAYDMPAQSGLQIDVSFSHADGNIEALLFDASHNELDRSDTETDNERLQVGNETGGMVYAQIYKTGPLEHSYGLTVTAFDEPICNDDIHEENDDEATATPVSDSIAWPDLMLCAGNIDWYRITLPDYGLLETAITYNPVVTPFQVILYDELGNPRAVAQTADGVAAFSKQFEDGGDYWLKLRGLQAQDNSYDLSLWICPEDRYEPNNNYYDSTFLGAAPQEWNDLGLCRGDEDWYYIELSAGQTVRLSMAFDSNSGDLDLYMRDGLGNVVAQSTTTTPNEAIIYTTVNSAGYYFQITGYGSAQNTYQLIYVVESD